MELQAAVPEKEKKFRVSEVEAEWCEKMLNLYGEDYKVTINLNLKKFVVKLLFFFSAQKSTLVDNYKL